jgi:hypothetical protein
MIGKKMIENIVSKLTDYNNIIRIAVSKFSEIVHTHIVTIIPQKVTFGTT